jgi:hypothetical protein
MIQFHRMKAFSTALALACAVLIPLSGCSRGSASPDNSGMVIQTDQFTGVIFHAEQFGQDAAKKGTFWTPKKSDVLEAEEKLTPFLQSALKDPEERESILKHFKSYKRQYVGRVIQGKKEIFINFFCDSYHAPEWTSRPVLVLDGGACFFQVHFSMEKKTFFDLQVNGMG